MPGVRLCRESFRFCRCIALPSAFPKSPVHLFGGLQKLYGSRLESLPTGGSAIPTPNLRRHPYDRRPGNGRYDRSFRTGLVAAGHRHQLILLGDAQGRDKRAIDAGCTKETPTEVFHKVTSYGCIRWTQLSQTPSGSSGQAFTAARWLSPTPGAHRLMARPEHTWPPA